MKFCDNFIKQSDRVETNWHKVSKKYRPSFTIAIKKFYKLHIDLLRILLCNDQEIQKMTGFNVVCPFAHVIRT